MTTRFSHVPPSPALLPEHFRDEVAIIETRSLWLRWPHAGDRDALQAVAGCKSVALMTATWPHPLDPSETARRIELARAANAHGRGLILALALKAEPTRLIGLIGGSVSTDGHSSASLGLGYMLAPGLNGRGLMTEAVAGLVRETFIHSRFERFHAACRIDNPASRRVLEKVGFVHVGRAGHDAPARGGPIDTDDFEIDRELWLARPETRPLRAALVAMRASGRKSVQISRPNPVHGCEAEALP